MKKIICESCKYRNECELIPYDTECDEKFEKIEKILKNLLTNQSKYDII